MHKKIKTLFDFRAFSRKNEDICRTMEEEGYLISHCLECGDEIAYGKRSDSKFCCDRCRHRWHYRNRWGMLRSKERQDRCLEKNYEILLSVYESGLRSIDLPQLTAMGFRSEFASTVVRGRTSLLMTCYDFSYKMSETKIFGIRKDLEKRR